MILAWILFIIYMLATSYLGWIGFKKTKNFSSFAIGMGDLHPIVVSITMAASVASAATFIINPGFIYVHGLSAFMHFCVSVGFGFSIMLALLSFKFQSLGEQYKALTMPQWIGIRYQSKELALFFSIVNLFSIAFVVLIVGGLSIVMQKLLGLSNTVSLIVILGFVTGYVLIGGTYAHVFTNTLQGSLMLIVSIVVLLSGISLFLNDTSFWNQITQINPNMTDWVNKESNLYNSVFSIYISGFIIGAALVCQPHILTKALYLKSSQAIRSYLIWGILFLTIFFLLPFAGFYAFLTIPYSELLDPSTQAFRQDLVMVTYIQNSFPDWISTVISIVLLAAGMSTLDGILVSLSTITANDLFVNSKRIFSKKSLSYEDELKQAYHFSHFILIAIAIIAFIICLHPPKLLGIFGQVGVYTMVVTATPALLAGILFKNVPSLFVWLSAIIGGAIHLVLYFGGSILFPTSELTFSNPGVPASIALLITIPLIIVMNNIINYLVPSAK